MNNQDFWIPGAIPFFLFGLLYYLISPIFVFPLLSERNDTLFLATNYLENSYFDSAYVLDVLFIFLSFYFSYSATKSAASRTLSTLDYCSSQAKSPLLLALAFLTLIIYFLLVAIQTGPALFTGYSDYDIYVLGAFSTLVFMSAWFVNFFSEKRIRFLFLIYFIFCSLLLLGWGSRMYFVLSLMALSLGLISHHKGLLKRSLFYFCALIVGIFIVFVGVLREGGTELNSDKFLGIIFAEPLFSAVSGFLFLENSGGRPANNIPYGLYASVLHFIPSFLFLDKTQLVNDLTYDEKVNSPFGGTSLIVNLYLNFGMFYPVFLAAIGSYYGFLFVKSQDSIFYRSVYFSALPILLFLFYRDGITTIMKVLFFNGLIGPFFVARILTYRSALSSSNGFR